jgi:hypothetical protein
MIRSLSILILTVALANAESTITDNCGPDKNGDFVKEITYTDKGPGHNIWVRLRQARYDFSWHNISGGESYDGDQRPADYKPATIDGEEIPGTNGKNPFLGDLSRYRRNPESTWPAKTVETLRYVKVRFGIYEMLLPQEMHIHLLGLQLQREKAGGKSVQFLPDPGGEKLLVQMIGIEAEQPYLVSMLLRKNGQHKVINHGDWNDEFPNEEKAWELVRKASNEAMDNAVDLVVKFAGSGAITRDEKAPGKPIVGVNLHDTRGLMDADLKPLAAFTNLTSLRLSECWEITDAGMKELISFENLTTLYLCGTGLTDVGLKDVAKLKNLTTLHMTATKVTDAGIKELSALKNLTTLVIFNSRLTDAGVKELAALQSLTTLSLYSRHITPAGLKELAALKNLTALTVIADNASDAGVKELAALKGLTELNLWSGSLTDAGAKELAALKGLTKLDLKHTKVTRAGAEALWKALPKCEITR